MTLKEVVDILDNLRDIVGDDAKSTFSLLMLLRKEKKDMKSQK